MKNLKELLVQGKKKNEKYYLPGGLTESNILDMHLQNILNMRTVNEGTATAGSFCNKIMEIASNYSLNLVESRTISDIFQRVALDSKHTGAVGGYKASDWFQIAELLIKVRRGVSRDEIRKQLLEILKGENTLKEITGSTDELDDFNPDSL